MIAFSKLTIVKLMELALTCTCVGVHYHSYNGDPDVGMLVTGTFVGFLVIFAGGVLGHLLTVPHSKQIDIFFSLIGVALFVASGAVLIDRFQYYGGGRVKDMNLAKASLSIINGALLLLDAILTQRGF